MMNAEQISIVTKLFKKFSLTETTQQEKVNILCDLLDAHSVAYPNKQIIHLLANQVILSSLFTFLRFNLPNPRAWDEFYPKQIDKPKKRFRPRISFRYRSFSPLGTYPNKPLKTANVEYFLDAGRPQLLVNSKIHAEEIFDTDSEVHYLNRWEVVFATSLSLATHPYHTLAYFDNGYFPYIPGNLIRKARDIPHLFNEYRRISKGLRLGPVAIEHPASSFRFYSIDVADRFYKIFHKFDHSNPLLLRTCFTYIKAQMLWVSEMFHEDALLNLFLTIEGSLSLIHQKINPTQKNVNFKAVNDYIEQNFPNGNYIVRDLAEAYEKRLQIVHPNSKHTVAWTPILGYSDFGLYEWYCKLFINYLIDSTILRPD